MYATAEGGGDDDDMSIGPSFEIVVVVVVVVVVWARTAYVLRVPTMEREKSRR